MSRRTLKPIDPSPISARSAFILASHSGKWRRYWGLPKRPAAIWCGHGNMARASRLGRLRCCITAR